MVAPLPDGKFDVILSDPPWSYNSRSQANTRFGLGVHGHYPVMSLGDIKAVPVGNIAAKDSVLFLWATFPRLQEALDVMKVWGFTYKTVGFNWTKTNPKKGGLFFGIGYYSKSNGEVCLLGTKGRVIKPATNKVSSAVLSPRREHSRKPNEVIERIELMYPTQSKVELFARETRMGWVGWGNETCELLWQ